MECTNIYFSGHALRRMFDRALSTELVTTVVRKGETIAEYQDDRPYPSRLILGFERGKPVHVVVARDEKDYACYVITAYIPSRQIWHDDFKTRKKQ